MHRTHGCVNFFIWAAVLAVKSHRARNQFELEGLEPRLLLSADGLAVAGAIGAACAVDPEDDLPSASATMVSDDYASVAEVTDDIWEEVSIPLTGSESQEASATSVAESESAESETDAAPGSEATESPMRDASEDTMISGSQTISNALTAQLTETLHAANGPPSEGNHVHLTVNSDWNSDSAWVLGPNDLLTGSGTISGGLVNDSGVISPGNSPGITNVATFTQNSGGTTIIEIGGTAGPGVDPNGWDQINVSGLATLGGTLKIELYNGFIPSLGDTFEIFTWGSVDGEFENWLGTVGIPGKPDLAFKPTYTGNSTTPGSLVLTVVQTPALTHPIDTAILDGLDKLGAVADFLENVGGFAQNIPLIGAKLSDFLDFGSAINNAVRNQLTSLLTTLPRVSQVTAAIESWHGTTVAGFTIAVKGVLGNYGATSADPMWWTVNLELTPAAGTALLQNILDGIFGAAFSGSPIVSVNAALTLDFSFGHDGGFFLEIDKIIAEAIVNATGLDSFAFNFNTPAGMQTLSATNGSVNLTASVSAAPDDSILTGGRINVGTLANLANGTIAASDAFNLTKSGTLDATFPLIGTLNFLGFTLTGDYAVRIQDSNLLDAEAPDVTLDVNSTLTVMGQTLNGSFTLKNTGTQTIIEASNVSFDLNAGTTRILAVENGSGKFVLLGTELAGTLTLDFHLGPVIPNLSLSATNLTLTLNTSAGTVPTIDGEMVNLPAGPYYRVSGNGTLGLANPQASLTGDFVFEPRDADSNPGNGYEEVAVAVANLAFAFDDGSAALLNVTNGTGAFVFRSTGVVGVLNADAALAVSSVSVNGTFGVQLNDTAAPYSQTVNVNGTSVAVNVAAGPFLRVTATGSTPATTAQLTVLGIAVNANMTFERKQTSPGGDTVVTVAASSISLDLGSLTHDLLSVTGGSGAFIINADGIAGEATATVTVSASNVGLTGTFTLRINDTNAPVNQTVVVNGAPVLINLPAGPYLQIRGTGATLTVLGISVSGNFTFEQKQTTGGSQVITVSASNVSFNFGTSLLTATNGSGFFMITTSGIAGEGQITVAVNAFGAGFSHTFTWSFNNTGAPVNHTVGNPTALNLPAGPFNQLSTNGPVTISVDFGGFTQSITAELVVTLIDAPAPEPDYITVGVSNLSATLAAGPVNLNVSGGTGAFVIFNTGIAGKVTLQNATLTGASLLTLNAGNLRLEFNNTGANVGPITVPISNNPADNVTIQFTGAYYHNYLAVTGTAEIVIGGSFNVTFGGNFLIEKSQTNPNQFNVGVEALHFAVKAGSFNVLSFENGSGGFVITPNGLAGVADLEFEVGIIGVSGDITLEVNTTSGAVTASVPKPGGSPVLINLTSTNYLLVGVTGHLLVGSVALPFDFAIRVAGSLVELRRKSDNELLVSIDSTGAITLGTIIPTLGFDFGRPTDFELVSMLRQLVNWLEVFSRSSIFNVQIPFTDRSLGDALDWAQLFMDRVYSEMASVELQSRTLRTHDPVSGAPLSFSGTLINARLRLQIGADAPVLMTLNGVFSNLNDLVSIFNAARPASLLSKVEARINKDGQFVIALLPGEIAKGSRLNLLLPHPTLATGDWATPDNQLALMGFGPGDGNDTTVDQVGIETARYPVDGVNSFFTQLHALLGLPGTLTYSDARRVYSYTIDFTGVNGLNVAFNSPFSFGGNLGPIGSAQLNGNIHFSADIGFQLTLGFDLGAHEVPRILSSPFVPVPAHGRLSANANFQVFFDADLAPINVVLPRSLTTGNTSIEDLAADLNTVFAGYSYNGTPLSDLLIAQRAGTGLAISVKETHLGLINRLTLRSLSNDVFATEMGFGVEVLQIGGVGYFQSASNSTIKGLFIENAELEANLTVTTPGGINGSLRFGFVDVNVTGGQFGTLDYNANPTSLNASVRLEDQTTGEKRFYISELFGGSSSVNIGNMVVGPDFQGSFLVRLPISISLGGFGGLLGTGAQISAWIPSIKHLTLNLNPYDPVANNQGIFLTFPNIGHLNNFECLTFTQVFQGLSMVADQLKTLSAFSFLSEPLPLINISVGDLIDYAGQFAELVQAAAAGESQSLQQSITELKRQVDALFNLNPNVLTISLDTNGITANSLRTAGGVNSTTASSATINPNLPHNGFVIRTKSGVLGTSASFNNTQIRLVGSATVAGNSARIGWDANNKTLTIEINPGVTTAQAIVDAINNTVGLPWEALLLAGDGSPNLGTGAITTAALKFSMVFQTGYANSFPLQLDLRELLRHAAGANAATLQAFLDLATTLVQIEGSADLTVNANAALTLEFGIDLTDPCNARPFFYDTTGVELTAKVRGTNINIEASLGSVFGIFIRNGSLTIDGDGDPDTGAGQGDKGAVFRLGLKDNNGDGRHYFNESWFNDSSIDLSLTGGVTAYLPIYAPMDGIPLSGDADANGDGFPDNWLVLEIPDLMRLFYNEQVNTRTVGNSATVRFAGVHNDLFVTSSVHTNYRIVFLNTLSGGAASASFSAGTNTLTVNIDAGNTTASTVLTHIQSVASFNGSGLTSTDGKASNGTPLVNNGSGKLLKLLLATPDFSQLFAGLEMCEVISSQFGRLLDGLDKLLGTIQDGLNSIVLNARLPLIGSGLAGAANFIQDFRAGLLQSLRDEVQAAGGDGLTALENAFKKAFWNTLGPGGLDLLVNAQTGTALNAALGFAQLDVTIDCDEGLIVNLRLRKEAALVNAEFGFDIGVPGFGLAADGSLLVKVGFDLKFGFGMNKEDGFFFNTGAPGSDPELRIYFEVTLPNTSFTGQLFFIQLDIIDDADNPSSFIGEFVVDLRDPNRDGKLTFAEIVSSGTKFSDVVSANLQAVADVNLQLIASFGGNSAFPRVLANFHLGWTFDLVNGAGKPLVEFRDLYLDIGSFLSDFLNPVLSEIRKITEPFQPIIDIVTARLPILSDLAGKTITLLDLAEFFGLLEPSTRDFIEDVLKVIGLINKLEGLGQGSILIPFGAFSLSADASGRLRDIGPLQSIANQTLGDIQNAIQNAGGPGASQTYKNASAGFVGDMGSLSNFRIPIFDNPAELFNLFIGEPVRLVEWRMPTFKFEFTYTQKIPIYPPLYAQFGGRIGAEINVGFGYDTYGIQKFIAAADKNALDLLDGFYVIDPRTEGKHLLELRGEIFAGASIDLGVVTVGVNGGVFVVITFDLNDPNNDGKVRVSEIIANALQGPLCIFDIKGEMGLFLEAFLKVDLFFFSIDKTWRFAEIVLFSFESFCPKPVLASLDGAGVLTLHMGPRAADRLHGDTTDNNERFIVINTGGSAGNEEVEVQWGNHSQSFSGVSKIVGDGGLGDDYIDLRGVLSTSEIRGGAGNDIIYLSAGPDSRAWGDDGDDIIIAHESDTATGTILHGGKGKDILIAGTRSISIFGDEDADVIIGSREADELHGGGGNDFIRGGDGDDFIDGGDGNDTLYGEGGSNFILGGAGADIIYGGYGPRPAASLLSDVQKRLLRVSEESANYVAELVGVGAASAGNGSNVIDGGDGDDQIYGGAGNDLLIGGNGSDKVYGFGGSDLLIGDKVETVAGLDVTYANRVALTGAVGAIPLSGITVTGLHGSGNDFLVGGGGADVIFGGDGDDFLYGGNMFVPGVTQVIEEDHNDFLDGGRGNDVIFGDDAMGRTGVRNTGIAIRSSIFFDANGNGLRDGDETGFGGVTVELFKASTPPELPGSTPVATVKTDSDGSFAFLGLDPNDYILVFSLPNGMSFITANAGGAVGPEAASNDSDVILPLGANRGRTAPFDVNFDETERAVTAGYAGPARVSISDVSVVEGSNGQTAVMMTVTLSHVQGYRVEIVYHTSDGTATAAGGDYVPVLPTTLVFNPGETSKTITLLVNGDTMYEPDEQFFLRITRAQVMEPGGPVNLQVNHTAAPVNVLVTIINDDPIPEISIRDFVQSPVDHDNDPNTPNVVFEGAPAEFIVWLSNPSQSVITVQWRTDFALDFQAQDTPNAATPSGLPGADFQMASGTLVFQPGETQKKITVTVFNDSLPEPNEIFYVDLFNPTFARIKDGRAFGVIADDDPDVSVSIRPLAPVGDPFRTQVSEGNTGMVPVTLVVSLSGPSAKEVRVTWATAPGTAVEAIWSGQTPALLPDYEGASGELVFLPGQPLSQIITIWVYSDNLVENDGTDALVPGETFYVNLIGASNAEIARNAHLGTESNHVTIRIVDDDTIPDVDSGPWNIWFSSTVYTVREPGSGSIQAEITLMRAAGSSHALAVFYTLPGGFNPATPGLDYDPVFRQLVRFEENELVKTVHVTIHSDSFVEGNETVILRLSNPTGGPVKGWPDTAVLIIEDGFTPEVAWLPVSLHPTYTEGSGGGVNTISLFVYLRDPVTHVAIAPGNQVNTISVNYNIVELTARLGSDFTLAAGFPQTATVTFAPGEIMKLIQVNIVRDNTPELTERFAVQLKNPSGATIAEDHGATFVTIHDDDPVVVTGTVFYDNNGNGFKDIGENGIKDVSVTVTWLSAGVLQSAVVKTNASGIWSQPVFLGQVSISVDPDTVTSPFKNDDIFNFFFGTGHYDLTTSNETQTVQFDGVVGISPFGNVGYQNTFSFAFPTGNKDVGRGGTDDTIFGGPGNDWIDGGAGDDHIVGGHWMTATDGNVPINQGKYDAVVTATTAGLHVIYDNGPIFAVDTSGLNLGGVIRGEIWIGSPGTLFTGEVLVWLFDCNGNPINAMVTSNGKYEFTGLYVWPNPPDEPGDPVSSQYVVQFNLPHGYQFVAPGTVGSEVVVGGRTTILSVSAATPVLNNVNAGVKSSGITLGTRGQSFVFSEPNYSVSEAVKSGYITIAVTRSHAFEAQVAVVRTVAGTALPGVNYVHTTAVLFFDVGETVKYVHIRILNTKTLGFCVDPLVFGLELRDPTGRLLDTANVYIGGESFGTITDDDTIFGGDDWDIILGDSGNIPAHAVIGPFADIHLPQYLGGIVRAGGPGKDTISGGNGPDFIDGQLGDDILSGDEGRDIVFGGLGNDLIYADLDNDHLRGDHGYDTLVSSRDVARIELTAAVLIHFDSLGFPMSTFTLLDQFEMVKLFGGLSNNVFDIRNWGGSAMIFGGLGNDTLLVESNTDMILKDASLIEQLLYSLVFGFAKDASISLDSGQTFDLGSLENVTLKGGVGNNVLDASGYSRVVTFIGSPGNDTLIGGSANDRFLFNADVPLGTTTIKGNGGIDTLDFTGTTSSVSADLALHVPQVVNANLTLVLLDDLENVTGGSGDDFLYGNALDNVLTGGGGSDWLEGRAGNEKYVFDTDIPWGMVTIVEHMADPGHDILDFSGTTMHSINLNMGVLGVFQTVNANLQLRLIGEGIEEVIGGALDDVIRGNSNNNILRGGPGNDLLDGKGGNDLLDGGPGNNTLLGGTGVNMIISTGDVNFTLSDAKLTRSNGEVDLLDSIQMAWLIGGPSANIFNLTGWTGSGRIDGADDPLFPRTDTVIVAADANFTLTDTLLTVSTMSGPIVLATYVRPIPVAPFFQVRPTIDAVILSGGPGNNTIDASGFSGSAFLAGGEGNDTLIGGKGFNVIHGGPGNDLIIGGPGNNVVDGGTGINTYQKTSDAHLFVLTNSGLVTYPTAAPGGEQWDTLANIQNAILIGGAGNNRFDVSGWTAGAATINGMGGTNAVQVQAPTVSVGVSSVTLTDTSVTFTGGLGTITLVSIQQATILGTEGDDVLDASAFTGTAFLYGQAGDDVLIAGRGATGMDGGAGNDRFVFGQYGVPHFVVVVGGEGEDTLDFSAFTAGVTVNLSTIGVFQAVLVGELSLALLSDDVEIVIGGSGADTLTGNSLDNTFTGGLGADNINGGGGINRIVETRDANFILTDASLTIGGEVDTLANIQRATLTGGAGSNTLNASAFTGDVILIGLAGNDVLIGGAGNDVLIGGSGNNTLRGGPGDDRYIFNADQDVGDNIVDELPGAANGIDTLDFSRTTTVGVTINLSLTTQQTVAPGLQITLVSGDSVENVVGTHLDDTLIGNSLDNEFFSGRGNDVIDGRAGTNTVRDRRDADFHLASTSPTTATLTIISSVGSETKALVNIQVANLTGGEGHNTLDASEFIGTVFLYGMGGNDVLIGGTGGSWLDGGDGHDVLYGGSGINVLIGGAGNDTLWAGAGTNFLLGGLGNDSYIFDLSRYAGAPGTVTVFEDPGEGFADALFGLGASGSLVNLFVPTQYFYRNTITNAIVSSTVALLDPEYELLLTLNLSPPGTVEFSFA